MGKYNKYDKYAKNDNKTEVKTMDKNKAPHKIEGTYMVRIKGNKTIITPVSFEDTVRFYKENRDQSKHYRCYPDDKFDAGWVLNDYLVKKDMIGIGERVTVVDYGECYSSARDWIITFANAQRELGKEKLANDILLNWGGSLRIVVFNEFRVVDSAIFESAKEVYLIVDEKTNKFYLIDRNGLKRAQ